VVPELVFDLRAAPAQEFVNQSCCVITLSIWLHSNGGGSCYTEVSSSGFVASKKREREKSGKCESEH
jgi:hypothetical protein